MLVKTKGIILRNTNYSESSIISKVYTREYGIRTYMLNGVRKGKGTIRPSMVQPLSLVQMDVYEKARGGIQRVKEMKNDPLLVNIHSDMLRKTIALFMIEMLNYSIQEEACETELFDFLEQRVLKLESEEVAADFPITFLIDLSEYLGFKPQGSYSASTPYLDLLEGRYGSDATEYTASLEVSMALYNHWLGSNEVLPSGKVRKACLDTLLRYYQIHLHKQTPIRSVEILSELLH